MSERADVDKFGLCWAWGYGGPGPNYGKPHVYSAGTYDGGPRRSCLWCGRWLND